jgi:adenosylcobinamide-GDP ribazoletransferase
MNRQLASLWRALAFLSRYLIGPGAFSGGRHPLAADAAAFPIAGCLIALPAAACLWAAVSAGLSPYTAALLSIMLLILVSGALHEDGLADSADGLFGHQPRERALDIMKDSRLGTYGGLALILSVLMRVSLLAEIAGMSAAGGAAALLAAAAASRGGMVVLWHGLPPARIGGVADQEGRPDRRTARSALVLATLALVAAGWPAGGAAGVGLALVLALAAFAWFRTLLMRRLGGQTGDTLGAVQQLLEIAILAGLALSA